MQQNPIIEAGTVREPVVLTYSMQRRWERNVLWLVGIICVSHFLCAPAGIGEWPLMIRAWAWIKAGRGGWNPVEAILANSAVALEGTLSLSLAICSFLFLMRPGKGRRTLIVLAWLTIFVTALNCLLRPALGVIYHYNPRNDLYAYLRFANIESVATWCYPLVLLTLVLRKRDETRWQHGGWTMWWLTASACMWSALPTVLIWSLQFTEQWPRTAMQVFSFLYGGYWWDSINGIGVLSNLAASICTFGVVAWTLLRGKGARWSLMICAALWIVSALGSDATNAIESLHYAFESTTITSLSDLLSVMRSVSACFMPCVMTIAFALSVRMALNLTVIREALDGAAPES